MIKILNGYVTPKSEGKESHRLGSGESMEYIERGSGEKERNRQEVVDNDTYRRNEG